MKKHLSKMLTLVCILCASVVMFACGAKKDINIESIELVGSVPEYIVIGEFDNANIQILVTYSDDSTETVTVTSSMIAEEDRHYLEEEGVYNVTILFKGEETVITVKMVENNAVHLVKFYDGYGRFIMSEFVLDGEDAVCPTEEWLQMDGYSFVDWDRLTTNVTEDINVYGIYSKVDDTITDEVLKEKLVSANKYFEEHDHIMSTITEDNEVVERLEFNYHYNDGNFSSQVTMGEEGTNSYGIMNITENGYTRYGSHSDSYGYEEECSIIDSTKSSNNYTDTMFQTALVGDPDEVSIQTLINSCTAEFSTSLYGNRSIYTAVFTIPETDSESYELRTIIYDDEKILQMKYEYVQYVQPDGRGEHFTYYYYIDYTTVAFEEVDFDSLMNIEEYKTELATKIAELKTTDWTAQSTEYSGILTHVAGEDTVTVGEGESATTINLSDLIPSFDEDAYAIYVEKEYDSYLDEEWTTIGWSNDEDYIDYSYDENGLFNLDTSMNGVISITR